MMIKGGLLISSIVLLSACATNEEVDELDRNLMLDINCPGKVERSYSTTIYSSSDKNKPTKTVAETNCVPNNPDKDFIEQMQ
jgi:hypothetical protein